MSDFDNRKQQQIPIYLSSKAGWFLDPWDLSGNGNKERWWTGLIWSDRTRIITNSADRDNVSVVETKEKLPC